MRGPGSADSYRYRDEHSNGHRDSDGDDRFVRDTYSYCNCIGHC
jgi:hypothetical protein